MNGEPSKMDDLPEHVRRNRADWDSMAHEWVPAGERNWDSQSDDRQPQENSGARAQFGHEQRAWDGGGGQQDDGETGQNADLGLVQVDPGSIRT